MTDAKASLEELRWKKFPVLNDGFVCLVDVMGDDSSVVQAARVSYGEGTKKVSDDRTLIRYLLRHRHTTPFEMAELKFLVRVPMDTWRQWIRHRTANVNEYSTRYSLAFDSAQRTPADEWRRQAENNRQGSAGQLDRHIGDELTLDEKAKKPTPVKTVTSLTSTKKWTVTEVDKDGVATLELSVRALDAAVRACGARHLPAEHGVPGYQHLDVETVLSWRPDALIVGVEPGGSEAMREWLVQHPGLGLLPCVRRQRILFLPASLLASTSPAAVGVAEAIQRQLCAWGQP